MMFGLKLHCHSDMLNFMQIYLCTVKMLQQTQLMSTFTYTILYYTLLTETAFKTSYDNLSFVLKLEMP
jgi:hypothetical protein